MSKISWSAVVAQAATVKKRRKGDAFVRRVLDGAIRVAQDKANPIRGNLCAAALRELVGHILHQLAPNEGVTACAWYTREPNTDGPTRRQRARYIVHAGLLPKFVENDLELDVDATVAPLLKAMDGLNRATHVRPETIVDRTRPIKHLLLDVLTSLVTLLDAVESCRTAVEDALVQHVDGALLDTFLEETLSELDELSTHTSVEGHSLELLEVSRIDATDLEFVAHGEVHAELQYGSDSDLRNDMGTVTSSSFPYRALLKARASDPYGFRQDWVDVTVDTSAFYQ